jgi:hypothetical protein
MSRDTEIQTLRQGAAAISELLAKGILADEDWERTAELLLCCRRSRTELSRHHPQSANPIPRRRRVC